MTQFVKSKATILSLQSTLTSRYQTTIPAPVRAALHLGRNDRISFELAEDGVRVRKVEPSAKDDQHEDSALAAFLSLIEGDLRKSPASVLPYLDSEAEEDLAFLSDFRARSEG